jgi:YgiT-type zinc finger domain-containing protein
MVHKSISEEFERDGLRVRITGIPAMVCPQCGDTSLAPGVADKTVKAANAMFEIAEERHRGILIAEAA